jgi:hypothetical protein
MPEKLTDKIQDGLISFARRHKVEAVYRGKSPEDDTPCFYLLKRCPYNRKFEDAITELEMKLFPIESTTIVHWPISPSQAKDYPCIEELIYSKIRA